MLKKKKITFFIYLFLSGFRLVYKMILLVTSKIWVTKWQEWDHSVLGKCWEISTSCVGHGEEKVANRPCNHACMKSHLFMWLTSVYNAIISCWDWRKPQTLKWTTILAACGFDCVSFSPRDTHVTRRWAHTPGDTQFYHTHARTHI